MQVFLHTTHVANDKNIRIEHTHSLNGLMDASYMFLFRFFPLQIMIVIFEKHCQLMSYLAKYNIKQH